MARTRFVCGYVVAMCLLGVAYQAAALRAEEAIDWGAKALALNNVTGEDPIRGELVTLAKDPAGTKKLVEAAVPLAKNKQQPFTYNAALILAVASRQVKDLEASQVFYRICAERAAKLRSPQKLLQAYDGFLRVIDSLYTNQKFEQSAKLSQQFLEILEKQGVNEALKEEALRPMIRALFRQGKVDQAVRLTDNLIKARGKEWKNLELKGWLSREMGHYEEAVKIYHELLSMVGTDTTLQKDEQVQLAQDFHYILSSVYMDLNQVDKAEEQLKILLKAKPNDPGYNNDLGYIWADHDMHLDEAERMIRKALDGDRKQRDKDKDLRPEENHDNAAYVDSLGWVLFKQKKYEEAKTYLMMAVKDKEGQHVEIFDHLGEVHMALGEKSQAIAAWKKGIEVAGPSKREQEKKAEVEKKLTKAMELAGAKR